MSTQLYWMRRTTAFNLENWLSIFKFTRSNISKLRFLILNHISGNSKVGENIFMRSIFIIVNLSFYKAVKLEFQQIFFLQITVVFKQLPKFCPPPVLDTVYYHLTNAPGSSIHNVESNLVAVILLKSSLCVSPTPRCPISSAGLSHQYLVKLVLNSQRSPKHGFTTIYLTVQGKKCVIIQQI